MNFSFETYYLHQDIIDEKFYDSEDDSEEEEEDEEDEDEDKKKKSKKPKKKPYVMDQDHRLLLRVTKPLLQSRNAAVSDTCMYMLCTCTFIQSYSVHVFMYTSMK